MSSTSPRLFDLPQTEEAAVTFLQRKDLLPQNCCCSSGHTITLYFGAKIFWKCNSCRQKVGIRVGNWLENTRLSFVTAVRFIHAWAFELTSVNWCSRELGIGSTTVVEWNSFMREVVAEDLIKYRKKQIGGQGIVIEIDESMFTRRKNHAGRILPQQWICGGICCDTGECFVVTISNRSAKTLVDIIKTNVAEGSIIYTDCWKGYRTEELKIAGYTHLTVNHKMHFVDPQSGAHTQNIERLCGNVKWRNKRHRGTARKNLDSYLAEFIWRKHIKADNPFEAALGAIAEFWSPEETMNMLDSTNLTTSHVSDF